VIIKNYEVDVPPEFIYN